MYYLSLLSFCIYFWQSGMVRYIPTLFYMWIIVSLAKM